MTQWPCSDSINLGRSPFASPSTELTWRAQHRARTRLSVEWKWLLSPWSMWHFWGTFVFNLRDDQKMPKELGHSCEPGILPQSKFAPQSVEISENMGSVGILLKVVSFLPRIFSALSRLYRPVRLQLALREPADPKGSSHGFKLKKFPISNGAEDKIWKDRRSVMKNLDTEFNKSYSHSLTNRKHLSCSS